MSAYLVLSHWVVLAALAPVTEGASEVGLLQPPPYTLVAPALLAREHLCGVVHEAVAQGALEGLGHRGTATQLVQREALATAINTTTIGRERVRGVARRRRRAGPAVGVAVGCVSVCVCVLPVSLDLLECGATRLDDAQTRAHLDHLPHTERNKTNKPWLSAHGAFARLKEGLSFFVLCVCVMSCVVCCVPHHFASDDVSLLGLLLTDGLNLTLGQASERVLGHNTTTHRQSSSRAVPLSASPRPPNDCRNQLTLSEQPRLEAPSRAPLLDLAP